MMIAWGIVSILLVVFVGVWGFIVGSETVMLLGILLIYQGEMAFLSSDVKALEGKR